MICAAIFTLAALAAAGPSFGQSGGRIAIYSDNPGFNDCNLNETLFSVNSVYLVHELALEGNTAQFRVQVDWPGSVAAGVDYPSNLFLGDIYTGVAVTYVGCASLPHLLARLDLIPMVATPACGGSMRVVADPAVSSGTIEVIDCNSSTLRATGGVLTINGNADCPCAGVVKQASWGRVKGMYN